MTATNHVVTGALVVAFCPNKVVGLILALLSHLLLDAIPHFGLEKYSARTFTAYLLIDSSLATLFLLWLLVSSPASYVWLITGGIFGASPDLLWIPKYLNMFKKRFVFENKLTWFLAVIQTSETRPGILVEIVWLMITSNILIAKIF